MISLTLLDSYKTKTTGLVHVVRNPQECFDWSHLIGNDVVLDGVVVRIVGAGSQQHAPPWKRDELIGVTAKQNQGSV